MLIYANTYPWTTFGTEHDSFKDSEHNCGPKQNVFGVNLEPWKIVEMRLTKKGWGQGDSHQ